MAVVNITEFLFTKKKISELFFFFVAPQMFFFCTEKDG